MVLWRKLFQGEIFFALTGKGKSLMVPSAAVCSPKRLHQYTRNNLKLDDMSLLELSHVLAAHGWTDQAHEVGKKEECTLQAGL